MPTKAKQNKTEFIKYLVFFALIWVGLTQGTLHSWILGIVTVPLATWMFLVMLQGPAPRLPTISIKGLFRFLPFFLMQSLRGGWESALFAIHPRKKVQLGFLTYTSILPFGRPQLYFLHVISLLPGTVSAAIHGKDILIHALDIKADHFSELRICEEKVAALFNLTLKSSPAQQTNAIGDSAL